MFRNLFSPEKIRQTTSFFIIVLLNLLLIIIFGGQTIYTFINPPPEPEQVHYKQSAPPPPPPTQQIQVKPQLTTPTPPVAPPTPNQAIMSHGPPAFILPLPNLNPLITPTPTQTPTDAPAFKPSDSAPISAARLADIHQTMTQYWGRSEENMRNNPGDPGSVVAKFEVFLAKYQNGDWGAGQGIGPDGEIFAGSLVNFCVQVREWTKGNIKAEVNPDPLDIGGPELLQKRPPFIYFTGHKDFTLTPGEVTNLQKYLQVGGSIWGDNGLAGSGSRFDIAFKREMKKVLPDLDKKFENVPMDHGIFTKSRDLITEVPTGMNYYNEPIEMMTLDRHLAILYCPNDYNDMMTAVLQIGAANPQMICEWPWPDKKGLYWPRQTPHDMVINSALFYRNYQAESVTNVYRFYLNVLAFELVQYDNDLLLAH